MPTSLVFLALLATLAPAAVRAARHPYESVGWRWTAVPILNFSSDDGAGYGARINLFEYDGRSVPYRRSYGIQGFFTTRGKWVHRIQLDLPRFRPGQQVEAEVVYEKQRFANYYGGLSDEQIEAYTEEQKTFRQAYPKARAAWIRDLRGPWRWRVGLQVGRNAITPNAAEGSILGSLNPLGAAGGTLFLASTSLRFDTRDDYLNATHGVLEEALLEYDLGRGGEYNGGRASYEHRCFLSLREGLVCAHRAIADVTFGDVPFYEALDLGGSSTVRGLPASRERGEARLLLNGELRWQGLTVSRRHSAHLGLLLFADAGRVYPRTDHPSEHKGPTANGLDGWGTPSARRWRAGAGGGLRLYWHSTVVRADYGYSGRKTGLYITFSHVF